MEDPSAQIQDNILAIQPDPITGVVLLSRDGATVPLEGGHTLPDTVLALLVDAVRSHPNTNWETIGFAAELWGAEAHITLTTFQGVLHSLSYLRSWGDHGRPTEAECREEAERLAREIEQRLETTLERDEKGCATLAYPWGSVFAGWDPRSMSASATWTWRGE
ncbi:MAG TPA: hypothetical protein PKO15_17580 [Fibrobacteria bacterium]|nr:hypothetical protein [Fibrobacteria bacterium]HOX53087.1 hypothetical protein [Fibrobacteria bacterium]